MRLPVWLLGAAAGCGCLVRLQGEAAWCMCGCGVCLESVCSPGSTSPASSPVLVHERHRTTAATQNICLLSLPHGTVSTSTSSRWPSVSQQDPPATSQGAKKQRGCLPNHRSGWLCGPEAPASQRKAQMGGALSELLGGPETTAMHHKHSPLDTLPQGLLKAHALKTSPTYP